MEQLVGSCRECWNGLVANGLGRTDMGGNSLDCRRAGVEQVKLHFLV